MKKITVALFAIAATVSGCELITNPMTNTSASGPDIELCLQVDMQPCAPDPVDDLTAD